MQMAEKDAKAKGVFEPPKNRDTKSIIDAINKHAKFGISSVASDTGAPGSETGVVKYPTGILSLDKYLGIGGLLGGRILSIAGWEGEGKTLTALMVGADIQRKGGKVAFCDAEGTFSPSMAQSVGINVDELILIQSTPEKTLCGEDYFDAVSMLIQSGVEFIIVDSVPAMIPRSRLTAVVNQGQKATHAAMMAEGLQQVTTLLNSFKRTVVWLINQKRAKPMVMFGPTEESTGGNAMKFFASYVIEVRKKDDIIKFIPTINGMFEETVIGVSIRATLVKNKTAAIPTTPIEFDIYFMTVQDKDGTQYHTGVDVYKDVAQVAIAMGVIETKSSWYSYGDIKANGQQNLIEQLRKADKSVIDEIRSKVLGTAK